MFISSYIIIRHDANYVNRNETILCDADEGCFNWYHWECEGLTEAEIEDIDQYACKGCLEHGHGKTTYKSGVEIPEDDDENDDGDEDDIDEYVYESEDENEDDDSGSESDNDSEDDESEHDGPETDKSLQYGRVASSRPVRGRFQLTD